MHILGRVGGPIYFFACYCWFCTVMNMVISDICSEVQAVKCDQSVAHFALYIYVMAWSARTVTVHS